MTREIKFRGKSICGDEWCYGTYIFTDDNRNDPFRTRPFKESHKIVFWCSGDWNMGGWVDEEVDPDTVGQFTGIKDKNGKEIYEGDIVKAPYLDPIFGGVVNNMFVNIVVGYNKGSFVLEYDGNLRVYISDLYDNIEVIGNIYDNPELLKGGEE